MTDHGPGRWEYKIHHYVRRVKTKPDGQRRALELQINGLATEGWELMPIDLFSPDLNLELVFRRWVPFEDQ